MRTLTMDTQETLGLDVATAETITKSQKTDPRSGKRTDLTFETVGMKDEFNNLVASFPGSNKSEKAAHLLEALKRLKSLESMSSLGFSDEDENRLINALGLSDKEKELLDTALQLPGTNFISLLKTGLMSEVKRSMSHAEKLKELKDVDFKTLSSGENNTKTFRGMAALKIQKAVESIIAHNESCQERADKIYISESILFQVTGSNRKAILQYLWIDGEKVNKDDVAGEDYKTKPTKEGALVIQHNKKHDLDDGVNRKGKNYDFKATLGL